MRENCRLCDGSGTIPHRDYGYPTRCYECRGSGEAPRGNFRVWPTRCCAGPERECLDGRHGASTDNQE